MVITLKIDLALCWDLVKKLDKIKKLKDKKIKGNLRFSTSCRYRDWERAKSGYYIWGVDDNIAAR